MTLPFYEKHLVNLLLIEGRKVLFGAVEGGFSLIIWDGQRQNILHAQRGHQRTFKNLTTASAYIHQAGVRKFVVCMNDESLAEETVRVKKRMTDAWDDDDVE